MTRITPAALAAFPALMLLAAPSAALVGCGGGDAAAPTADAASPEQRLIGKWSGKAVVNERAAEQFVANVGEDETARREATETIDYFRHMELETEFRPDGTLRLASGGDQVQGTWRIVKAKGRSLTLKTVEGDGPGKEFTVTFEADDTFTIAPPAQIAELGEFRFRRLR